MKKIILFANTEWYLYNFRRSLALSLRDAGYDVLLVAPDGPYGSKLQEAGLQWFPLPMERRSLNPLKELKVLYHLWKLMRHERPDLIHGFTLKAAIYGCLAAKLSGVKKRVAGIDGLGYVFTSNDLKARLLRPVVRTLLRLALGGTGQRLILLNKDDLNLFITHKLAAPGIISLIPGAGVDCQKYRPAERKKVPGQPLRVLLAARLLRDKGVAEYAEAANILLRQGRNIEFLLAGAPDPGNPSAVPVEAVRAWQSKGLVHWLGHVSDMPTLLATIDIMALPSYREGLPTCLTEAGAMGVALVTTEAPGCREAVAHEQNGLLVPPRDPQALANAIARLHDDAELATRLGNAARERVLREFDERIIIRRTMEIYQELESAGS